MPSPAAANGSFRQPHHIGKRKTGRFPYRFVFFDTETTTIDQEGTQRLVLADGVYWQVEHGRDKEGVSWHTWVDNESFNAWIESLAKKDQPLVVMSANIWFDLRVSGFLYYLRGRGWRCRGFFSKGHTFISTFVKGRLRIQFYNIQNYFNVPVKAIGESVGLKKLDVDFKAATPEQLKEYCHRDVEIIFKAFKQFYYFIKDNNLGSIGATLPAVAMSVYRRSFLSKNIHIHDNKEVIKLERAAYYGGRCECFQIGTFTGDTYYKLDVNGMYPYVMQTLEYPYKLYKIGRDVSRETIYKLKDHYCFIAEVEIDTKRPVYPYRQDGKLLFPVGKFTTYLSTGSLLHGIEAKEVVKIKRVVVYKKVNLFKDYVDYFWESRLDFRTKGNAAFAYACKILLNSLYGKFGQRASKMIWEKETTSNDKKRELIYQVETGKFFIHQVFFGLETMVEQSEHEATNSMPAICAHVTDHARLLLWNLIEEVGRKNLYYVDTDSLIVNKKGYKVLEKYLHPDRIGKLKIEDTTTKLVIKGAKNYVFGTKRVIKGISKSATETKPNTYKAAHFPTPLQELRDGLKEDYRITTITKTLSGKYDKGHVSKSGQVTPFAF